MHKPSLVEQSAGLSPDATPDTWGMTSMPCQHDLSRVPACLYDSVQLMFAIPDSVVAPVVRGAHNFLDSAGPGRAWAGLWADLGPSLGRPWANSRPTVGRLWAQALADLESTFG